MAGSDDLFGFTATLLEQPSWKTSRRQARPSFEENSCRNDVPLEGHYK